MVIFLFYYLASELNTQKGEQTPDHQGNFGSILLPCVRAALGRIQNRSWSMSTKKFYYPKHG